MTFQEIARELVLVAAAGIAFNGALLLAFLAACEIVRARNRREHEACGLTKKEHQALAQLERSLR